ncbi:MAG: iron ABC transporter permease [Clostridiales bacterium]|nr:iron ABC transporter permease [Candidatus Cacconaster stercorequi]
MKRNRAVWKLGGLVALLMALFLLSFLLGRYPVALDDVLRSFIGREQDTSVSAVVLQIRLPRILLACLVGACLSMAGTAYQGVFQNPMAAPDILGASSGAAFGAALAILMGLSGQWITLLAFAGSLLAVLAAYLVGQRAKGYKVVNLVLAGVMVSSLFSAGTSYLKLVADPGSQLPEITYWLIGSLAGAEMPQIKMALIPMVLGTVPLLLIRWRINVLTFGDEEARTMGVNASRVRLVVIICATLLTASSVSLSGMIGWVGLVIPHLCRRFIGNDYRHLLPASLLVGAAFLLLVDNFSRSLLATEIPIGILTALVGVPFFIYLMLGEERFT